MKHRRGFALILVAGALGLWGLYRFVFGFGVGAYMAFFG